MAIRLDHLRQADLNLLVYFAALVEEKSVSRAAGRLRLTQPAVSRALQRLRAMFNDELLVKVGNGFTPTARGRDLLEELAVVLPHLDSLISGKHFDASVEEAMFRITAADSLSHLYCPVLARMQAATQKVSFRVSLYTEERYLDLETNSRDLVLDADFKTLSPELRKEALFEDVFVCAVAKNSPFKRSISLTQYLEAEHVAVSIQDNLQGLADLNLTRIGTARKVVFTVPYFEVALRVVAGSKLIATLPLSFAATLINKETTRLLRPPSELRGGRYVMVWHRRQELDPRHVWLRQTFREATQVVLANLGRRQLIG